MDREVFEWRKYLVECLESTFFCAIATCGEGGVWANPVYFAYDSHFNIYFISQPHTLHMKNIAKNEEVSSAIFSTAQDTSGDVAGIQLAGRAEILSEKSAIDEAYKIYYGRKYPDSGKNERGKDADTYINNPEWLFVKIVPDLLYYFDTRFFDENRVEVPRHIYASPIL